MVTLTSTKQTGHEINPVGRKGKADEWVTCLRDRSSSDKIAMSKTIEVMSEIIRNPKPSFRKAVQQPQKAQKHRYERRKVKEIIRVNDWDGEG